jgi:hypothetical protein
MKYYTGRCQNGFNASRASLQVLAGVQRAGQPVLPLLRYAVPSAAQEGSAHPSIYSNHGGEAVSAAHAKPVKHRCVPCARELSNAIGRLSTARLSAQLSVDRRVGRRAVLSRSRTGHDKPVPALALDVVVGVQRARQRRAPRCRR